MAFKIQPRLVSWMQPVGKGCGRLSTAFGALLICIALPGFARAGDQDRLAGAMPPPLADNINYVPGSTQKICQITGENDRQTHVPTPSRTVSRFGLMSSEYGYSFEHDGKIFFLFGNCAPYPRFHGEPNGPSDPPRNKDYKDAIGYVPLAADTDVEGQKKRGTAT